MSTNFNKAALIECITLSTDIPSKAAATRTVELIISTIKEQVAAGNQVDLSGLCMFKPAVQAARSGVSTLTGKPFSSPAKKVVKIRPSAQFKAAVAV